VYHRSDRRPSYLRSPWPDQGMPSRFARIAKTRCGVLQRPRRPPEAQVVPVFKLFAESTKEHQVDSILCAACNPRPTIHQGCRLSGLYHHETFPEEPTEVVNTVSLTVCDKCGEKL
jgi:hypothetical protein